MGVSQCHPAIFITDAFFGILRICQDVMGNGVAIAAELYVRFLDCLSISRKI